MSENTNTYDAFVRSHFNRSGDFSKDFTHAILGFVTEVHEYLSAHDEINGLEELGDMHFYVVALQQVVNDYWLIFGVEERSRSEHETSLRRFMSEVETMMLESSISAAISILSNDLLDHAKRWVGYAKMPKSLLEVADLVIVLEVLVNKFGPYPNPDIERIQVTNMAKLQKRHGDKYSPVAADQRDTEAERAAIAAA
jgi:NTP pyrophosphatase (non-canonical NTP hydrolase)